MQEVEAAPPSGTLPSAAIGISLVSCRRPLVRPGMVARDDLLRRLLAADQEHTVVAVCAPAGYGKTTLLARWAEVDDRPFAWVQLDELDDDPVHLVQHIGLSLDHADAIAPETAQALATPGRPLVTGMVPALGYELQRRPPSVLVLDDVHVLASVGSARVLDGLVASLPPGTQLVVSGRSMTHVPLARWRVKGDILDLSFDDLRMSLEDAAQLFANAGVNVEKSDLERLLDHTEGWPGGLHLAVLAIGRRGSVADMTTRFSGRNRLVADYLIDEVLNGLPDEMIEFLVGSSVLSRMNAEYLDELLGTDTAALRLREIELSGNHFLLPLDDETVWYRYHHIFREMLRARLDATTPGYALELELRASRMLERHHDIDGAIRHAVAGEDTERASELILQHAHTLAFSGRAERLGQWLDLVGRDRIDQSATLALACSWYGLATGDPEALARGLAGLEREAHAGPLVDGSPSPRVAAALVRAVVGAWGLEGALRDAESVRQAGRTGNPWWGLATGIQGAVYSMLGDLETARSRLIEGLPSTTAPVFEALAFAHIALLDLHASDLAAADRQASQALAIADRCNLNSVVPAAAVYAVGSLVAARQGHHEEARRHAGVAERLLSRLPGFAPRPAILGYLLLAQAALAGGDLVKARSHAIEANRARRSDGSATFLNAQLDELTDHLDRAASGTGLDATPLTAAELRVLAYLPTHLSLQEIADDLIISRNTAKSHSVAIYRKLAVSSRRDAVQVARELGVLDL